MRLRYALPLSLAAIALACPALALAQASDRTLGTLDALHTACRGADAGDNDTLYSVSIDAPWRWGTRTEDEEFLPVDTRHNLRAFSGAAELLPSHMETIGFVANEARGAELAAARDGGARLRVGFFLGFDDPERSSCLIRPRAAVTLVRMDVAFVELVDAQGHVLAREDTERFRSWQDDADREGIPGTGPRAAIGTPSIADGTAVPDGWTRALRTASAGALGRTLGRCHADGVGRGALPDAMAHVRLRVDGRTGRVTESSVEIANVGDSDEVDCIVAAVAHVDLPAGSADLAGRTVDVSVPVTLAN